MADKAFMSFTQNGEQVGLGHSLLIGGDTMEYRALVSDVAKKIIEDYAGSTLAGSAQSVQAALAALNSNIDDRLQQVAVAGSGQGDYTFPSGKFGFCIWAIGTSTAGLTFLYATGSGLQAVKVTATSTSNNPTFSHSNGVLTIKNNGSSYMRGSLVFT